MSGQYNYAYEDSNDGSSSYENDLNATDLKTFKSYGSTNTDPAEPRPLENNTIDVARDIAIDEQERQKWGSPVEFLLSCIAMSVGLGNVWRFPYTAYENGGGAFLIPYLVVLIMIGRPLYFMELSMGQFSSSSNVKVWNMVPAARGVGFAQVIGTASVVSYYCVLIALSIYYLVVSCQSTLPWTVCWDELKEDNVLCLAGGLVGNGTNSSDYRANMSVISSAEQYFKSSVLKENPDITNGIGMPDLKLVGSLAACWVLLFLTLWKGVASSGKVAYVTAIFPYLVLITLLVQGLMLDGAVEGILFYIKPQWEQLLNLKVWYAAVTQSFFSLSTGFGALITYSSYNDFKHNSYRDAWIISFTDTFTSLLAGFVIFSILGSLAHELGVPVKDVVDSGPGLAFVSYPSALAKFDVVPQLFSVLFFLMLITLGLGSATGLTTGIITVFCDLYPEKNKTMITGVICVIGFSIGVVYVTPGGQAILSLVDFFGGGFIIFVIAIIEVIAVSWIYGLKKLLRDIHFMMGINLGIYWKFCLGFFVPISLIAIFIYFIITYEPLTYQGFAYPEAAIYGGWILTAFAMIQIPIWFCHSLCKEGKSVFVPNKEWGPSRPNDKLSWLQHVQEEEKTTEL